MMARLLMVYVAGLGCALGCGQGGPVPVSTEAPTATSAPSPPSIGPARRAEDTQSPRAEQAVVGSSPPALSPCVGLGPMKCIGRAVAMQRAGRGQQAALLLEAECEHGSAEACFILGQWLQEGVQGIPAEGARGADLVARACAEGNPAACDAMGH